MNRTPCTQKMGSVVKVYLIPDLASAFTEIVKSKIEKLKRFYQPIFLKFKGVISYGLILLFVSMFLLGVRLVFPDSLVIYIKNTNSDFIQVFFPVDGFYNEKNSQRSGILNNPEGGVVFVLPKRTINFVRIDPGNKARDVVIEKVELRSLFGSKIYTPSDLLPCVKPIQMIGKIDLIPSGLLIHSTGNDPAFKLELTRNIYIISLVRLFIISLLLTFLIFGVVTKILNERMLSSHVDRFYWLTPLFFSIGITILFYPGFMSYDSLHALRSARNGVTDSIWPPMVSYVWRVVDLVSLNPSAMHFSQVFLLLSSVFYVAFWFSKNKKITIIFLFVYLCIPAVLGTLAVIWKDVLMAAFFVASFAIVLIMKNMRQLNRFLFLFLLAVAMIFLGTCSRHNAFAGALPLIFYLIFVVLSRVIRTPKRLWGSVILFGFMLSCFIFLGKVKLDNYTLPDFKRLPNRTSLFLHTVRVRDVAGASLCCGKNLFGELAPDLSLDEIRDGYDPRHVNLFKGKSLKSFIGADKPIGKVWLRVLVNHPLCFFYNKFQLTKYLIGAHKGPQFLITHPFIEKNEFGISLHPSFFRDLAVGYIYHSSRFPLFKPWFLYLFSIVLFVYSILTGRLTIEYSTIYFSGFFYLTGTILFGNAADARLPFYTTTAISIFLGGIIFEIVKENNADLWGQ